MTQQAVNDDGTTTTNGTELRRVVAASVVGTALEWYDFFIYGFAVTLVFNELFFVTGDPATGTIVGFATFGVGFAVRPLGGFVFGHSATASAGAPRSCSPRSSWASRPVSSGSCRPTSRSASPRRSC
jgi:hypothetical protein